MIKGLTCETTMDDFSTREVLSALASVKHFRGFLSRLAEGKLGEEHGLEINVGVWNHKLQAVVSSPDCGTFDSVWMVGVYHGSERIPFLWRHTAEAVGALSDSVFDKIEAVFKSVGMDSSRDVSRGRKEMLN